MTGKSASKSRKPLSEEEIGRILELRKQGKDYTVIAVTVGRSLPTVYKYIGQQGKKSDNRVSNKRPRALSKEEIEQIQELHKQKLAVIEICAATGRSQCVVRKYIKKLTQQPVVENDVSREATKEEKSVEDKKVVEDRILKLCKEGRSKESIARELRIYMDEVDRCISEYKMAKSKPKAVSKTDLAREKKGVV